MAGRLQGTRTRFDKTGIFDSKYPKKSAELDLKEDSVENLGTWAWKGRVAADHAEALRAQSSGSVPNLRHTAAPCVPYSRRHCATSPPKVVALCYDPSHMRDVSAYFLRTHSDRAKALLHTLPVVEEGLADSAGPTQPASAMVAATTDPVLPPALGLADAVTPVPADGGIPPRLGMTAFRRPPPSWLSRTMLPTTSRSAVTVIACRVPWRYLSQDACLRMVNAVSLTSTATSTTTTSTSRTHRLLGSLDACWILRRRSARREHPANGPTVGQLHVGEQTGAPYSRGRFSPAVGERRGLMVRVRRPR